MAKFDYTLTDQDVGRVLGPADAYVTDLAMTTPPSGHETPDFSTAGQHFTSGYFTLRGSGDHQNLINVSPRSTPTAFSWSSLGGAAMVVNGNLRFRGDLIVVCVPKGSEWSITLSDVPNQRITEQPIHNFSGANFKPVNVPSPKVRERVLVER
jgi:hypothetical protein